MTSLVTALGSIRRASQHSSRSDDKNLPPDPRSAPSIRKAKISPERVTSHEPDAASAPV